MSAPFVAEIRVFAFDFAPTGWALCNGGLLPISQNTALFSLLGTVYGGDGKSTFALPNLQGAGAIGVGQRSGGREWFQGEETGTDAVTLLQSEIPIHSHTLQAATDPADQAGPAATRSLARSAPGQAYRAALDNPVTAAFEALSPTGGSLPHNNVPPVLTLNFCIAMQGVFPPRQ